MRSSIFKTQFESRRLAGVMLGGVILLGWLGHSAIVYANCQTDASQAMLLLSQFKQQALNSSPQNRQSLPSQGQFKAEFEPVVKRLQQGQCQRELMGLMGFIQAEQKMYPAPGKQ